MSPTSIMSLVSLKVRLSHLAPCSHTFAHDYLHHPLEWLTSSNVQKLVVVVNGLETNEVLERWVFNVETATEAATNPQ